MSDLKILSPKKERKDYEYDYLDGVSTIALQDLYKYADGVQLEGGYVYREKLKKGQKYANVSIVWDLPFQGLEAKEVFAHGNEKFRESRLEQYNEHQAINLLASLILFYLKESAPGKKTVFLFYIGKRSSLKLLEIAEQVLEKYDPELVMEWDDKSGTRLGQLSDKKGRTMEFVSHYSWLSSRVFNDASTVVGFSWNGGFNKSYKSGDIVIPTHFIDISRGKKFSVLHAKDRYEIKNDFQDNLQRFLKSQDPKLAQIVNSEFKSENPLKFLHKARLFTEKDFYQNATLLGTWDILEPSLWPHDVVIPD